MFICESTFRFIDFFVFPLKHCFHTIHRYFGDVVLVPTGVKTNYINRQNQDFKILHFGRNFIYHRDKF